MEMGEGCALLQQFRNDCSEQLKAASASHYVRGEVYIRVEGLILVAFSFVKFIKQTS